MAIEREAAHGLENMQSMGIEPATFRSPDTQVLQLYQDERIGIK